MALSHYDKEEATLVSYFRQMMLGEDELSEAGDLKKADSNAVAAEIANNLNDSENEPAKTENVSDTAALVQEPESEAVIEPIAAEDASLNAEEAAAEDSELPVTDALETSEETLEAASEPENITESDENTEIADTEQSAPDAIESSEMPETSEISAVAEEKEPEDTMEAAASSDEQQISADESSVSEVEAGSESLEGTYSEAAEATETAETAEDAETAAPEAVQEMSESDDSLYTEEPVVSEENGDLVEVNAEGEPIAERIETDSPDALYAHAETSDDSLQMQMQPEAEPEVMVSPLPFAEKSKSLESLLEQVKEPVAEKEEVATVPETKVETVAETASQTVQAQGVEDTKQAEAEEVKEPDPEKSALDWTNIDTPDDFQALFFVARGVRFAVPLVSLGGIYECDHVTPIFGKPRWYNGIADIRGRKINVVDTLRWVKPELYEQSPFKYIIMLGDSLWAISCNSLEGNRSLKKENVKWRQNAGSRPWLAGIVKKEMCALLHVDALVAMFEKGFNLKDLQ